MTAQGTERPAVPEAFDALDGPAETTWDDPLTRLLLLLEIADKPAWLRDVADDWQRGEIPRRGQR